MRAIVVTLQRICLTVLAVQEPLRSPNAASEDRNDAYAAAMEAAGVLRWPNAASEDCNDVLNRPVIRIGGCAHRSQIVVASKLARGGE